MYFDMKKLIVIIGPNGVGKTTTAKVFMNIYSNCAYVDSDWCRVKKPFSYTEEDKKLVVNNISTLLRNYLLCKDVDIVLFTYTFHGERKKIFDEIINQLRKEVVFALNIVILKCSYEENVQRCVKDHRNEDRIKYGMEQTFEFYDKYNYPMIETTDLLPEQVVEEISKVLKLGRNETL